MRDRLIELLEQGARKAGEHLREVTKKVLAEKGNFNSKTDYDRRSIYEVEADFLLDNGVIVSPLKQGDKVWIIDWCNEINEYEVSNMRYFEKSLSSEKLSYDAIMVGKNGADIGFYSTDIGKYVFLTKEEAVQALKGGVE